MLPILLSFNINFKEIKALIQLLIGFLYALWSLYDEIEFQIYGSNKNFQHMILQLLFY